MLFALHTYLISNFFLFFYLQIHIHVWFSIDFLVYFTKWQTYIIHILFPMDFFYFFVFTNCIHTSLSMKKFSDMLYALDLLWFFSNEFLQIATTYLICNDFFFQIDIHIFFTTLYFEFFSYISHLQCIILRFCFKKKIIWNVSFLSYEFSFISHLQLFFFYFP